MAKFAVSYIEIYRNTYIVEADTYEEAEEKLMEKAANCDFEMDFSDSFDHWDVEPSETFGKKEISDEYIDFFKKLPE